MHDTPGSAAPPRFILASGSPRRIDLLTNLQLKFEIVPSTMEEVIDNRLEPDEVVTALARQKASDVLSMLKERRHGDTADDAASLIVLGADTMVVLDKEMLGKPQDEEEACAMLSRLSGRHHVVHTGVCVLECRRADARTSDATAETVNEFIGVERSRVFFRELAPEEIRAYVRTGEPMDKAGAYALQGIGAALVARIDGSDSNVIGLPIPLTVELLRRAGLPILGMART